MQGLLGVSNVNQARLAAVVISIVLMMRSLAALMPNQNRSRRKRQRARRRRHIKGARASNSRKHKKKTKRKRDSSSSSAEDKPSDKWKKKGESSDDEKTAFPGTTYKYLGGKELPGTTADRAKIAYPKKFKLNILREMVKI